MIFIVALIIIVIVLIISAVVLALVTNFDFGIIITLLVLGVYFDKTNILNDFENIKCREILSVDDWLVKYPEFTVEEIG